MPELPEVESFRSVIEKNCLRKKILEVEIPVVSLLQDLRKTALDKHFKGKSIIHTYRQGKYLFAESSDHSWIYFHFGLTGRLTFEKKDLPDYTALVFKFQSGTLCFTDPRKFGSIGMTEDPEEFLHSKKWGPDILEMSESDFKNSFKNRKAAVKTILMNQHVLSGIGNEYSDEILNRARIHPERSVSDLDDSELSTMFKIALKTIRSGVRARVNGKTMKAFPFVSLREKGMDCPNCGYPIKSKTIGGRTAYYCSHCQK